MKIIVRAWEKADATRLFTLFADYPDLHRQLPTLGSLEAAEQTVRKYAEANSSQAVFCIEVNGEACGLVGLSYSDWQQSTGRYDRAWIWYWSAGALRRTGNLKEIVKDICDWAQNRKLRSNAPDILTCLTSPQIRRLELGYRLSNQASAKIALYAGFVIEGVEKAKFIIDGKPEDAVLAARL